MKLINFFKKIIGNNEIKEPKKESLDLDEIINLFENKRKKIKEKEKEIFISIKDKISVIIKELNEKVKILERIDMESIKAEDRVKLIVKGNLNNYINHTKNFAENIYNLKEENLEKFIVELNEILLDFNKKSYMSYQKATFLIGNEIAAVKESIINFSKYLEKLFKENKDIIDSSKIISSIKLNLKNLGETEESIKIVDEKNISLDEKTKNIKEANEKILREIEKIKKTSSYIENLKKQEEVNLSKKELENNIYNLKQLIDLKSLANLFHNDEEKWNIIKFYKEDFQTAFKKDNGADILNLLKEAKIDNEIILIKIKQINDKREEIIKDIKIIKKDEIEELSVELKKIKLEIENLNNKKTKELKKYNKLKTKKEEIINSIKQEWNKTNN